MHGFFHCDAQRSLKRRKYIIWLTLLPLFQGSVIIALITITNMRFFYENGHLSTAVYACAGTAAMGTLIFFIVFSFTEKSLKRNSRYTFFEIGGKTLVFSRYNGESIVGGKRVILRKLYVTPLSALKAAGYNPKSGAVYLQVFENGEKIRMYRDRSERLNYRLEGGIPAFESWWYNENGYESLSVLKIPRFFGEPKQLCEKIAEAKSAFDNAPKPRPYTHKESDFIKRKKAAERLRKFYDR